MGTESKYIVFDGMDGSGKGKQIDLLKKKFGSSVVFTREPGGPPLSEDIRKIIRDNPLAGESSALFHFLAFWAAREESIHRLVTPALQSGKHVFSDRGDSSTYAFQLYGEQHEEFFGVFDLIRRMVFGHGGVRGPNLYIIFDLPAEVARERALQDANRVKTHFDVRDLAYYERVRVGFRRFGGRYPLVRIVDATQTPEEIHQSVMEILTEAGITE